MNKKELVKEIQKVSARSTLKEAEDSLNNVLAAIEVALRMGEDINISGFGKFYTKERPARTCRNPKTSEMVEVPASTAVGFKPSTVLKKAVQ